MCSARLYETSHVDTYKITNTIERKPFSSDYFHSSNNLNDDRIEFLYTLFHHFIYDKIKFWFNIICMKLLSEWSLCVCLCVTVQLVVAICPAFFACIFYQKSKKNQIIYYLSRYFSFKFIHQLLKDLILSKFMCIKLLWKYIMVVSPSPGGY